MPIKLNGATSGSIELDVPAAVGSDLQLTLPATAGDVVVKAADGSVDLGSIDIDSSGNVGIGTSSPSNLLTVSTNTGGTTNLLKLHADADGTDNGMAGIKLSGNAGDHAAYIYGGHESNGNTFLSFYTDLYAGSHNPTERMRIRSNGGSFHFSNTSFVYRTARTGAGSSFLSFQSGATTIENGTQTCRILADGDLENSNNNYGAISDVKLKENIVDAESQWEDLKGINIRNYNFKEELGFGTNTHIGVVAQELELVSPNLVKTIPDRDNDDNDLGTTTKSVKYSVLYMKAVKALQEAMERIETLETKVAALEATP